MTKFSNYAEKHKNRSNKNNGKGKCKIKENKMKLIEWQNRRIVKNNKNSKINVGNSKKDNKR